MVNDYIDPVIVQWQLSRQKDNVVYDARHREFGRYVGRQWICIATYAEVSAEYYRRRGAEITTVEQQEIQ